MTWRTIRNWENGAKPSATRFPRLCFGDTTRRQNFRRRTTALLQQGQGWRLKCESPEAIRKIPTHCCWKQVFEMHQISFPAVWTRTAAAATHRHESEERDAKNHSRAANGVGQTESPTRDGKVRIFLGLPGSRTCCAISPNGFALSIEGQSNNTACIWNKRISPRKSNERRLMNLGSLRLVNLPFRAAPKQTAVFVDCATFSICFSIFQHSKRKHEEEVSQFKKLHGMGVDLSRYVLSQSARPDKVIRIVADDKAAVLHLHRNWPWQGYINLCDQEASFVWRSNGQVQSCADKTFAVVFVFPRESSDSGFLRSDGGQPFASFSVNGSKTKLRFFSRGN